MAPRRRPLSVLALPGLVLGILGALHGLTRPALWLDEASSVGAIRDLTGVARQSGGTMSAYYLLLRAWSTVSSDPVWLRSLSLLLGLLGIVLTVRLARDWLGEAWAAVTGACIALSFLWGDQAAEARSYAMTIALAATSWIVLDRLVARPSRRTMVAYLVVCIAMPPTHGLMLLILGAQVAALLVSRVGRRVWTAAAPGLAIGFVLTAALFVLGAKGVTNWVEPTSRSLVVRTMLILTGPTAGLALVLVAVIALGIVAQLRSWSAGTDPATRFRAIGPVAWGVLPVMGLLVLAAKTPILVPRYLTCAVPGIALLLASGIRAAGDLVAADRRRTAHLAAGALVLVGLVPAQLAVRSQPSDRWDRVSAIISHDARDGDALLFPERRNRVPFEAAWHSGGAATLDPVDFPRPLGAVHYTEPERNVGRALQLAERHDRVWFVYQNVFHPSTVARHRVLADPGFRHRFRLVRTWSLDRNIEVRLYVRR